MAFLILSTVLSLVCIQQHLLPMHVQPTHLLSTSQYCGSTTGRMSANVIEHQCLSIAIPKECHRGVFDRLRSTHPFSGFLLRCCTALLPSQNITCAQQFLRIIDTKEVLGFHVLALSFVLLRLALLYLSSFESHDLELLVDGNTVINGGRVMDVREATCL
jgi:hypothetical protein